MLSALLSRCIMLVFGTLYPAYRSYKAVKNKDVREYVKWMMYWIIFALFITVEAFADVFISWLPLYYELKIVFLIWLLSPATKGSSILYRKFVHPRMVKHEKSIDKYIAHAQNRSYATFKDIGIKGFNVATDTLMKTAVTGQYQLMQTIKRYNSMQELRETQGDDVDAPYEKRNTWYQGMPSDDNSGFDPENDVDALQRQYKTTLRKNSLQEEEVYEQLQRSQSDLDISHNASGSRSMDEEDSEITFKSRSPSDITDNTYTSNSVDYNYAYSSSTLPRARKSKKPIHETMPDSRTSRPKRTNVNKKPL